MNENHRSIFKLFLAADIGSIRLSRLLAVFGEPKHILNASKSDLLAFEGIGEDIAKRILNAKDYNKQADEEIKLAAKNSIVISVDGDENYPSALLPFSDRPPIIYIKGTIIEKDFDSIGIVGSRKITPYGKRTTEDFASFFAKNSITVISGLARGIDAQAHKSALENNGRTIAVLGNGLLVNYPPENKSLQTAIPDNGAVISEFPLLSKPDRTTFPRRNRIVAALSKALLVVEAAKNSGALITAKFAADYGKDVFAVPSNIYNESSKGVNELIANGAFAAVNPRDMALRLSFFNLKKLAKESKKTYISALSEQEKSVLKIIEIEQEGIHIDLIADKLNINISQLSSILFNLELNELVECLMGKIYVRKY
ncbi:MAG: DNA-processing protein DprA [Elusimicrobiota bacterium]|jgi:DNA processing protein|nr:DNA-processing protein DprA [Elusimicrobiota bacterium]